MANQAPSRPWFRLASLRSVAAAAAAPPPPQDRINSSLPSSPAHKPPVHSSSSSSLPTSPLQNGSLSTSSSVSSSSPFQKPSPPSSSSSSPAKGGTSPSTKQLVHTVMQSPKAKPTTPPPPSASSPTQKATAPQSASSTTKGDIMAARGSSSSTKAKTTTPPPSPLTLPPAQLKANSELPEEAESKGVILQKRIEKPKQRGNGNYAGETQKNRNEKQNGNHRKSWGLEDSPMKVITIAGENRGAYMELMQSPKKNEFGDKPNNYLYKKGESGSSSSDEGNVKRKENKNNRRTKSSHPMPAFMNSNVQCVNNSLLYNASCSHHDPGVRLSLTRKPLESGGFHFKEIANGRNE